MDDPSKLLIPRRATARLAEGRTAPAALSEWRDAASYVLLADPGAGKTETFKTESRETGGQYCTARDFVVLAPRTYGQDTTLFIDGLDEMRAGSPSRDEPLDAIRRRLDELGRPRFRLACREADWIGAVDADALRSVAPGGELAELRLEPLDESDIRTLLLTWPERVPDVDAFWAQAEQQHIIPLLGNPLNLELIVDAVQDGRLPASRTETYKLACERLASEQNKKHQAARRGTASPVHELLDDAGLLCATMLLAGAEALTHDSATAAGPTDVPVETLPKALGLRAPDAALASKLFTADGERHLPRHRTIAEYLSATAAAGRIAAGLPASRVLALMSGFDGGIVEPLRGMHAWLAVQCPAERLLLIDRDPLGVVLYGDVSSFTTDEKRRILDALGREARRFVWFRNGDWAAHPFGALGTPDMVPAFDALFNDTARTPAHQSLLDCLLDAIRFGESMPALKPTLEGVIRDSTYTEDIRGAALQAWLAQSRADPSRARAWLDDILGGQIDDSRDELCGQLLDALYPDHVSPDEVMQYFHLPKAGNFLGTYRLFWDTYLVRRTPVASRAALADGMVALRIGRSCQGADIHVPRLIGDLTTAALEASSEHESPQRTLEWLRAGMDEYGFVALKGSDGDGVRDWLGSHPDMQKAVLALAYSAVEPDPTNGQYHFWRCERLLHQARRPADWFRWLLDQAAKASTEALARYLFENAASAAIHPSVDYDITMEDVECWVEARRSRWPRAGQWLEQAWSLPLDHWQAKEQQNQRAIQAEHLADREKRHSEVATYAEVILTGTAPPGLMHDLALAYRGPFSEIYGDTPEARIQDYRGGGAIGVANALAGLAATLTRSDLPTVAEILKLGLAQREHYIRPACLVGAEIACHRDPDASASWSDELASRLVAFWLTDGTGEVPTWYNRLVRDRPALVAEVLGSFAKQAIRKRPESGVTGLWALARDDDQRDLARGMLPELLRSFPARANQAQLRRLNQELLPAATRHLDCAVLAGIAANRLALKSLDAGQRIAWLVASLAPHADGTMKELIDFVGKSQTRSVQLGDALVSQNERHASLQKLAAPALSRLIHMLAPHASPERSDKALWVGDFDHRRDLIRGFIRQLAASADDSAAAELARLRSLPELKLWAMALDSARAEQTRVLRSARFQHASVEAVALTLANQAPANASDLCALTVDQLRGLGAHIRGDDTNSVGLFWREGRDGRLVPEIENTCRDRLIDKLRDKLLRLSVQLEKEASAANDTRADLRVSTVVGRRRIVVPIEVKKEDHQAVWAAWRNQLDGSYTTDPAAQGFGIYLVLWFGHKPKSSAEGMRPRSAAEFESLLRADIPAADRARLTVVVLDLALPGPPKGSPP